MKKLIFILLVLLLVGGVASTKTIEIPKAVAMNTAIIGGGVPSGEPGVADPTDQFSANPVFSIGTTATELDNEGTITVASNIATFSIAFPTNVGVGDVVQYDVDNGGDVGDEEYGIIHGISTDYKKAYLLKTDGSGVTNTTASTSVYDIFRAYTTHANAQSGTENTNVDADCVDDYGLTDLDLTDGDDEDGPLYFAVYADGALAGATWDGWTTDADDFIKLFAPFDVAMVGTTQRHDGKWNASAARIDTSGENGIYVFDIGDGYMIIEDMQFVSDTDVVYLVDSADVLIHRTIIINDAATNGIEILAGTMTITVMNSAVYCNTTQGGSSEGIYAHSGTPTVNIYNSVIENWNDGIEEDAGTVTVKNSAVYTNGTDFDSVTSVDFCASDDGTGTNEQQPADWTAVFVDEAGHDYHLKDTDTDLKDNGTDLSGSGVSTDIDGDSRTGTWDIGVDVK